MSNHLINNLECFNNLHGNHIINNFRALIIYSSFSSNNKLLELSYRYLCDFIDSFIYNGFTKRLFKSLSLIIIFLVKRYTYIL